MNVRIVEMPIDFGASKHGSDMGPHSILLAGLAEAVSACGHGVPALSSPLCLTDAQRHDMGDEKARYLRPVVRACEQLAKVVEKSLRGGEFPLVLGGDHSIFLGSIAGFSSALSGKKIGVLYIDAHGDFNTCETSPTGNIHGMPVAASCGLGNPQLVNLAGFSPKIDAKNVFYAGLRDLDPLERDLMKNSGATAYSVSDIDRIGVAELARRMKGFFVDGGFDAVFVSVDLDAIDPNDAPGTGITVPNGLSPREALLLCEEVFSTGLVRAAEIVELNPAQDVCGKTARLAVELTARLLGKRIW